MAAYIGRFGKIVTILSSHAFSSHSFKIEYLLSLDGQMSTRWPWMEIFPKLYQMFSVARLSALGDSRLALHWYYFIWMRWMQGISSKHLLKTMQSIVALMSRPMPSEIINVLISQI